MVQLLTFVISIAVCIIQLFVNSKQAKLEKSVTAYVDKKFDELEAKAVLKEQLELEKKLLKEELRNELRK